MTPHVFTEIRRWRPGQATVPSRTKRRSAPTYGLAMAGAGEELDVDPLKYGIIILTIAA